MESALVDADHGSADLWVVVPAYHEARVIQGTLEGLRLYRSTVVVVDDGSTDGTGEIARAFGVRVVRHPINLGQGAAIQTGIDFALAHGARFVCTFDADGQHDPATIDFMRRLLQETNADVALGSRFLGGVVGMSTLRRIVLVAAVAFTRMQTGLPVTDTHNGIRLLTRAAAEKIQLRQAGMAHGSEILSAIVQGGLQIVEAPTTIRYTAYSRAKGQSLSNSVKILLDLFYASMCRW